MDGISIYTITAESKVGLQGIVIEAGHTEVIWLPATTPITDHYALMLLAFKHSVYASEWMCHNVDAISHSINGVITPDEVVRETWARAA